MKNQPQKRGASTKQKSPKLKLNKQTLKDLDAKEQEIKGGLDSNQARTCGCAYGTVLVCGSNTCACSDTCACY